MESNAKAVVRPPKKIKQGLIKLDDLFEAVYSVLTQVGIVDQWFLSVLVSRPLQEGWFVQSGENGSFLIKIVIIKYCLRQ